MVKGNWTAPMAPPGSGISPMSSGPMAPRYSRYDVMRFDDNTKAKQTRIVSPYLSFETDRPAMQTFRRMLRVLDNSGFAFVVDFDGPELGIERSREEKVQTDEVIEKLATMDDMDVPSFLGIRATLQYEHDEDVTVRLKVKIGGETKVKVTVKGTLTKHVWNQLRANIRRKFHVKV